jgi:hypothetical protein
LAVARCDVLVLTCLGRGGLEWEQSNFRNEKVMLSQEE